MPSPQPGTPGTGRSAGGQLAAVAALSFEDAWTVGWSGTTALAEHWDGSSWQLSPVAGAGRYQGSRLLAVAASPVRGAWAVGAYQAGRAGPGGQSRGLIGRWNGTGWALAAAPLPSGAIGAVLNGVTVSSSGVWQSPPTLFTASRAGTPDDEYKWQASASTLPVIDPIGNTVPALTGPSSPWCYLWIDPDAPFEPTVTSSNYTSGPAGQSGRHAGLVHVHRSLEPRSRARPE